MTRVRTEPTTFCIYAMRTNDQDSSMALVETIESINCHDAAAHFYDYWDEFKDRSIIVVGPSYFPANGDVLASVYFWDDETDELAYPEDADLLYALRDWRKKNRHEEDN